MLPPGIGKWQLIYPNFLFAIAHKVKNVIAEYSVAKSGNHSLGNG
jgi:hypothetical protein